MNVSESKISFRRGSRNPLMDSFFSKAKLGTQYRFERFAVAWVLWASHLLERFALTDLNMTAGGFVI